MSGSDKSVTDMLANISDEIRKYSGGFTEYVDENFDRVADRLREQLANSVAWLPDTVKAQLPQKAQETVDRWLPSVDHHPPLSLYERTQDWVLRHKVVATLVVLVLGTATYKAASRALSVRKYRRARRARNGARCEVVVVAASPALPVTQSLALDLERRGFVVYVVCGSAEDEAAVRKLSRQDIKPLSIDITDPGSAAAALDRFALYLSAPHAAVPGARRSHLTLTGVVLVPSLNYQTSPIATIPPSSFADLFNTHLLHPILTIQAFLPLLTARTALQPGEKPSSLLETASSLSNLTLATIGKNPAAEAAPPSDKTPPPPKVLVLRPSIISSVNPPFHAPESTICSALSAFTEVLAAELRPLNIPVTHIQLGTFDFTGFAPAKVAGAPSSHGNGSAAHHHHASNTSARIPPSNSDTLSWPEPARHMYGRNFTAQSTSALGSGRAIRGVRGTQMRDLHHAVFDVLDGSNTNAIVRVGLGADLYGFVGVFVPRGLVAWMMGVRKVDSLGSLYQTAAPVAAATASNISLASAATASTMSSSSETASTTSSKSKSSKHRSTSNDFVAVQGDSHIWR